jgi:REP element-mobilizing transposase RayT
MARSRYRFLPGDPAPYFVTATTVNWLPLFSNPEIVRILLDSFRFLIEQRRLCLHAYVILENHLHLIASADDLGKEIANFKSFTARKSIDYYLQTQKHSILEQLSFYKGEHKHDRPYQFWQEGVHPQRIQDQAMLKQKLDYIHQNPVRRGYVDFPEQWRYSSARDYVGVPGLLPVEAAY